MAKFKQGQRVSVEGASYPGTVQQVKGGGEYVVRTHQGRDITVYEYELKAYRAPKSDPYER